MEGEMITRLRKSCSRIQGIKFLQNENTLASGWDTVHDRKVLLKELSLTAGAYTTYNHLQCQYLNLPVPRLYHCHNFDSIVITECEYVPGKDLFYHLTNGAENNLNVLNILEQLLHHIKSYQKNNLSHLDIKPENLIWDSQKEKLSIIDFESMRTHSATGYQDIKENIGTPDYTSPEIFYNYKIHRNTDLWNVGMVGYILTMRHNPLFENVTDRNNMQAYAKRAMHNANIDPAVSLMVTSLLHPNPEYRSVKPNKSLWDKIVRLG